MRTRSGLAVLLLTVVLFGSSSCVSKPETDDEVAVFDTSYGRFVIEFLPRIAPKHVENFKSLVREGFYDETKFHRIVKDNKSKPSAIQGGDPNTIYGDPAIWGQGQRAQKMVRAEFSSLRHERGIVSAARRSDDINSATSQFFVCVGPQPGFDNQYSIFGRVVDGMNVIDSIARAPTDSKSERPIDPVTVNRAYLAKRGEVN